MKEQARFWFVHARVAAKPVSLAVAAFTARSARVQARKQVGADALIVDVMPVTYAHAWVMNLSWEPDHRQ